MQAAPRRLRRAAQGGGDLGVRQVAAVAERHRGPLLRRQRADGLPEPLVGLRQAVFGRGLGDLGDRDRPASAGAMVVDRLAVGDRQQPAAQVARVAELGIGAQRRQKGLLEAVLGSVAADGAAQDSHHRGGMLVQNGLKRRQRGHSVD